MEDSKTGSASYAAAGVNLSASNAFSAYACEVCRSTYNNSPFVEVSDWSEGNFRGPRPYEYRNLPEGFKMVAGTDGIGTKTVIITAANAFDRAVDNLYEMVAMDIARWGGLGLVFLNTLEVKSLGSVDSRAFGCFKRLMAGMGMICREQGCVALSGETAEMSDCVSSEIVGTDVAFNWSGAMLGVNHKDKLINGSKMQGKKGLRAMVIQDGLGSNGASLIRRYLRTIYGVDWWEDPNAKEAIAEAARPTAVYSKFFAELNGWYADDFKPEIEVYAIAHISGGGIREKFAEAILFPRGFSARLENLFEPSWVVRDCVKWKEIGDDEAYTVFNGGQRAVAVISEDDVEKFIDLAKDHGLKAQDAGPVFYTPDKPQLEMLSRFSGEFFTMQPK